MPVSRRGFLRGSGVVAGAALAGMTFAESATAAVPALPGTPIWLLANSAFASLDDPTLGGSPKVCRSAFNQGETWFSVRYADGDYQTSPVPSGYSGVAVLKFEAYQNGSTGLVDAIAAGLPGWVEAVQYDPENWDFTPEIEQGAWLYNDYAHAGYAQLFCETAHQHGLRVVLTPANDLCNDEPNTAYPNDAPQYPLVRGDHRSECAAYIRLGLASAASYLQSGDLFEYQAQQLELDSKTYHSVTTKVGRQVTAAKPGVPLLAGLGRSALPSDGATAAQLTAAASGVYGVASGFWLNVGEYSDQVRPMINALKNLGY